jgi:hypothetical protein
VGPYIQSSLIALSDLSRSKEGSATLDAYLSHKHAKLLAKLLQPDSYRKRSSLAIVDGFAVEITEAQVTNVPLAYKASSIQHKSIFLSDHHQQHNAGKHSEIGQGGEGGGEEPGARLARAIIHASVKLARLIFYIDALAAAMAMQLRQRRVVGLFAAASQSPLLVCSCVNSHGFVDSPVKLSCCSYR